MVRRKEVSSRELTELLLDRIDALNPDVNAVVELRPEAALKEAEAADRATADAVLRPLHGVPATVKESFNVAGLHTTWGNPAFKDYVADADATVVRRLRHAGAIIVGKTNVHAMLADYGQTANEIYGVTNNPLGSDTHHPGRLHRRRRGRARCWVDVPRVRLRPGRLDSHPGELLRRVRPEAKRRDRAPDRISAARSAGRPERDDVHVGCGAARPVGARFTRSFDGHGWA
jgi:hypothetical protein